MLLTSSVNPTNTFDANGDDTTIHTLKANTNDNCSLNTTIHTHDTINSCMTVWVSGSGTIEEEPIPLKQYYCPSSDLYMYHMRQNFERNWTQVDKTFSLKYSCTSGEPMCICTTRRCYAAVDSPNMTVEVVTLCEDPDECTQGLKARIEDPLDGSEAKLVGLNRMWRTIYTSSAQRTNGKLKDIGNEAFISNVSFLSCGECPIFCWDIVGMGCILMENLYEISDTVSFYGSLSRGQVEALVKSLAKLHGFFLYVPKEQ
ncbi:hypothetical protein QR680_007022 [Steinernema hermaphroditum]|uniref:Uncharacterized protein n=1 Tax=Steinernema hermaphroditum TaxID=289476 RepID=A0AA39HXC4_9BILA|nr:hypothetical protein QR680_007022 [Steinernema hermaphroditum]